MKISIAKEFTFDSAHCLTDLTGSKCQNMHGHTYRLQVFVTGQVQGIVPMVMDLSALKTAAKVVIDRMDHQVLNHVFEHDNPTAEFMVVWLHDEINKTLPAGVAINKLVLWETPTSFVELEI